jgi:hypothetical protein
MELGLYDLFGVLLRLGTKKKHDGRKFKEVRLIAASNIINAILKI